MIAFIIGFVLGATAMWAIYHFNVVSNLKAERDSLKARLDIAMGKTPKS
jgi:hypothetical protein